MHTTCTKKSQSSNCCCTYSVKNFKNVTQCDSSNLHPAKKPQKILPEILQQLKAQIRSQPLITTTSEAQQSAVDHRRWFHNSELYSVSQKHKTPNCSLHLHNTDGLFQNSFAAKLSENVQ